MQSASVVDFADAQGLASPALWTRTKREMEPQQQHRAARRALLATFLAAVLAAFSGNSGRAQACPPACPPPGGSGDEAVAGGGSMGLDEVGDALAEVGALGEATLPITFWNSGSCPFAQRAWIALEEKQLPYKFVKVDLQAKPADFVAAYASVSPVADAKAKAKVPVVQTADGYTMIESDVVAEYLSDRFPDRGSQLMPESAEQRARVRLFITTFDQTLGSSAWSVLGAPRTELGQHLEQLEVHLRVLDDFLKRHGSDGGPFLCGDLFSLAEVHAAPFVQRMLVVLLHFKTVDLPKFCRRLGLKRLRAWLDGVDRRPSVIRTGVRDADIIKAYEPMLSNS